MKDVTPFQKGLLYAAGVLTRAVRGHYCEASRVKTRKEMDAARHKILSRARSRPLDGGDL